MKLCKDCKFYAASFASEDCGENLDKCMRKTPAEASVVRVVGVAKARPPKLFCELERDVWPLFHYLLGACGTVGRFWEAK